MTDEERKIMDRALTIVRDAQVGLLEARPAKLDVLALHCHPDDEAETRAVFDAPIVVDPTITRGHLGVVPFARADTIKMTVGFTNPTVEFTNPNDKPMTDDQIRDRIASELLLEALQGQSGWWWVSFVDGDPEKFVGVAIVEANGRASAIRETHKLGINPGGRVLPVEIPPENLNKIPEGAMNRLLRIDELRALFPDLIKTDGTPA